MAAFSVTLLYLLVTLGYYLAADFETITGTGIDLGMSLILAPKAFGSATGLKIAIALSAIGNLNAVVFTSAKVKQAIAAQQIIPFYKFFKTEDTNFLSPRGALILHWTFSVILICVTPNTSDGYSFIVGLFTYGHICIGVFIALGFHRLADRMKTRKRRWQASYLSNHVLGYVIAVTYGLFNIVMLVGAALGPSNPSAASTKRYWWLLVTLAVLLVSFCYWVVLWVLQQPTTNKAPVSTPDRPQTIGSKVGLDVTVYHFTDPVPEYLREEMNESWRDGSRRRVIYTPSGVFKKIISGYDEFLGILSRYLY